MSTADFSKLDEADKKHFYEFAPLPCAIFALIDARNEYSCSYAHINELNSVEH